MQLNLSHGEMFQRIFEGGLPEKTYSFIMLVTRWFLNNCNCSEKKNWKKNQEKKLINKNKYIIMYTT